ncbi:MAG TPA: class E sortase [Acidimicrobiales bacterium]|nr:class E sortase [Acidimicrobiales bacterium]
MRPGLVTGALGRILLFAGVLILLFVAYQLWGTGIKEAHSQAVLRQRFDALLHRVHDTTTTTPTTTAPTTTTTAASPTTSAGTSTTTTPGGDQPTVGATLPAPGDGDPVGVLQIPKIGLDKVIVEGTSTSDLQQGPGHYPGTPLPGEAGNAGIAGHRTTYGAPFYNLNELTTGDLIEVTTVQGTFYYRVTGSQVVSPDDVAVVAATTTPELTLTTCNPRFSASTRLVVHADLSGPPAPTIATPPPPAKTGTGSPRARATAQARGLAGGQGDWLPALWLGLLSAVVMAVAFAWSRRYRRRPVQRWAVYAVGGAASLVALFFFFGAVSPLLPASF